MACCRLQALTCLQASCSEVWCSQQYTGRSCLTTTYHSSLPTSIPELPSRVSKTERMVCTQILSWYEVGQQPGSGSEITCGLNIRDIKMCQSIWPKLLQYFPSPPPLAFNLEEGMAGWGQEPGITAFTYLLFT